MDLGLAEVQEEYSNSKEARSNLKSLAKENETGGEFANGKQVSNV